MEFNLFEDLSKQEKLNIRNGIADPSLRGRLLELLKDQIDQISFYEVNEPSIKDVVGLFVQIADGKYLLVVEGTWIKGKTQLD